MKPDLQLSPTLPCDPLCHSPGWQNLVMHVQDPEAIAAEYAQQLGWDSLPATEGMQLQSKQRPSQRLLLLPLANPEQQPAPGIECHWALPMKLNHLLPDTWRMSESRHGLRCQYLDGPSLFADDSLEFPCSLRCWSPNPDTSAAFYRKLGWMVHPQGEGLLLHPLLGRKGAIELLPDPKVLSHIHIPTELHFPVWRLQRLITVSRLDGQITQSTGPLGPRLQWRLSSPEGLELVFFEDLDGPDTPDAEH